MRNWYKIWLSGLAMIIFLVHCKKPFEPDISENGNSFLVVTGFVNVSPASVSTIILSRTLKLTDTITFIPEDGASITLESSTGVSYSLSGTGNGKYISPELSLPIDKQYRLNIVTRNGVKYQSAFVAARRTPAIDSVTWEQNSDVKIFVNTHDPANNSRYYWWDFTETSQYQTPNETPYGVKNGRIYVRAPEDQIHICWATSESTDLLLGSSELLGDDIISKQLIHTIPFRDKRLFYRYSILVRQHTLTANAYKYWLLIQKNSQQLGTLFDQQPSQLTGNIRSLSNPDEPVVGYFTAAEQQEKRIFIEYMQLNDWIFDPFDGYNCAQDYIGQNPVDPYIYNYPDLNYVPWYFISNGPLLVINKDCVDCTTKGGTNKKPSFW